MYVLPLTIEMGNVDHYTNGYSFMVTPDAGLT